MANYKNKTLPIRERNEVSCEQSRRAVVIPVVVEPVVVPVPRPAAEVQIADIEVAVGVAALYRMPPLPPPLEYSRG